MPNTYILNEEFNIVIKTTEDGVQSSIPIDLGNSDYQAYLKSINN